MYPYNRNTRLYAAPIQAKERAARPKAPLSADRRLRELLLLAREDAALLEEKYAALLEEEALVGAKDILKTMATDQKKHRRILRELLFELFRESFAEEEDRPAGETMEAEALLESLLFAELDDIPFFRSLLAALEEEADLWNLLFEILTDKQNHAAALNHLYAKYFVKTSGK